jgi:hypothetical protein
MKLKKAIKILKRHNKWRRGADIEMGSPTELGIAIDVIIKKVKVKSKSLNPEHQQKDRFKHYLRMAKFNNNKST